MRTALFLLMTVAHAAPTTDPLAFGWFESGFGLCSKPCGLGIQTQDVYCRRFADEVPVPDNQCATPKPSAVRRCNAVVCPSNHAWNVGPFSVCSRHCGGGTRERQVVCQEQSGTIAADEFCKALPKPLAQENCNPEACTGAPTYRWIVTPGPCSKPCGEGLATDSVICRRNDGAPVADSFCKPARKPPAARLCNVTPCNEKGAYEWKPGPWSACSVECGDGLQTRSVVCQREDGNYVREENCNSAERPTAQQSCHLKSCPAGRKVTQNARLTPAHRNVDLLLVVDDSTNMAREQAKLAVRLSSWLGEWERLNADVQLCMTTTDAQFYKGAPLLWPGLNSARLTPKSPNAVAAIALAFKNLREGWSADEQGLKAAHLLVRDFRSAECVRSQGLLLGLVLSDEDERSVGGLKALSETQFKPLEFENDPAHLLALIQKTWEVKPFIWNSLIVRPSDKACQTQQDNQGSPSFPGERYAELTNKTGGVIADICAEDFAPALAQMVVKAEAALPGIQLECIPSQAPTVTLSPPFQTSVYLDGQQLKFRPIPPSETRVTAVYTCPH